MYNESVFLLGTRYKTVPKSSEINSSIVDILVHAISINSGYTSRIMVSFLFQMELSIR